MSDRTAIEHFWEYPLSWEELQTFPEDQQAALAVFSYAASEANALSKLYSATSHSLTGENAIDCAISTQLFVILRTWSSKLFEVEAFLNFKGKNRTSDQEVLELAKVSLSNFSRLRDSDGYLIARDVRNEASHHYSFTAAKKNLKHVSARANCTMYLHEMNGNSFYPMGEEVLFIGRLNRRGAQLDSEEKRSALLGKWMDWNIEANSWLNDTHAEFMRTLVLEKLGNKFAKKRTYWIDPVLVGKVTERKTPVFLRKDR